ncbi:MAG TPA: hypothetical protein VHY58_15870 [Streptosporangiaceae bacterium]|jgi:hypothetical protein|nr:hypothetical protein [Streptosporangiaceae bacterium]
MQAAIASGGGDGCNPNRSNNYLHYYFDGADSQNVGGTPGGVYASIRNYSPFVAGPNQGAPSNDDVSEWVMLDVQPASDDKYVQIGWIERPGGLRNTFVEWSFGPGKFYDDYYSPYAINSTQSYAVYFQPTENLMYGVAVNGNLVQRVADTDRPNDAQIYAEIHTQASQVPGGTADPSGKVAQVSAAHVWPTAGSSKGWQNFDGVTGAAGASWLGIAPGAGTSGVNSWRTWDKACKT